MKTLNNFSNSLLQRKELTLELHSSANPGIAEITKNISEHFKVGEDVVAVKKINNKFGSHDFIVSAFVYDSVAHKTAIEPKKKEKKVAG